MWEQETVRIENYRGDLCVSVKHQKGLLDYSRYWELVVLKCPFLITM